MKYDDSYLMAVYHYVKLKCYDCDANLIEFNNTIYDMIEGCYPYDMDTDGLDISVKTSTSSCLNHTINYIHVVCKPKETEEPKWEDTVEDYNRRLAVFDIFEHNFSNYLLFDKRADEDIFKTWKAIRELVDTPSDPEIQKENKAILIEYLEEYWFAWLESILDEEYKYMNLTSIVWDSWEDP